MKTPKALFTLVILGLICTVGCSEKQESDYIPPPPPEPPRAITAPPANPFPLPQTLPGTESKPESLPDSLPISQTMPQTQPTPPSLETLPRISESNSLPTTW